MSESKEMNEQVGEHSGQHGFPARRIPRSIGGTRSVVRVRIPMRQEDPIAPQAAEAEISQAVAAAQRDTPSQSAGAASSPAIPEVTLEDLNAFAAQIGELVDHARYRVIARAMQVDLARAEAASRRIPPPRLRLAE